MRIYRSQALAKQVPDHTDKDISLAGAYLFEWEDLSGRCLINFLNS